MRKNRRDLGESEKLSDLNVSWLWVKEREKEGRKEGRGEGGGKGGEGRGGEGRGEIPEISIQT